MSEVLIAGAAGGREHALGLALREDGAQSVDFTHSGNAGTEALGLAVRLTRSSEIAKYAANISFDLVVVGPEAPLVEGIADELRDLGVPTFGPGKDGAQFEASKAHTAEFSKQFGIRQPDFAVARTMEEAEDYILGRNPKDYVIKADGLAGGKGVLLLDDPESAHETVGRMMSGSLFGEAGQTIVFQRRLPQSSPEVSALYLIDGKNFTLLPLAQDHKRLLDGDHGPNTGGMGAYTPVPFADEALIDDLLETGYKITDGLQKRGIDYRGVVFAGMMLDAEQDNKPSLLEINVRFGDPEAQVVLAALGRLGINTLDLLTSVAHGSIDRDFRGVYLGRDLTTAALTVCLAAGGYPKTKAEGLLISGLDKDYEGVTFHHGGTWRSADGVVAEGGRIGYVTAVGKDADEAASYAYAAIGEDKGIYFEDMRYRSDIAWQARTGYKDRSI